MPPIWSLITVTYNSEATLSRFWGAALPAGVEWIVVDNGSSDQSVALAKSLGAKVIALDTNRGFSAANNEGLRVAAGRYIGFVNPDISVDWSSLDHLAATIDRTGGLVAPQLLNSDGSLQPNGRGAPLLLHKVLNRLSRSPRANGYQVIAKANEERYVFWAIGAAILGSAESIRSINGWNEKFFLYYEDKDICIRAWKTQLPVILDGGANWVHGWARETSKFRINPWILEFRSMATFYSLYPECLFGGRPLKHRHPTATAKSGQSAPVQRSD